MDFLFLKQRFNQVAASSLAVGLLANSNRANLGKMGTIKMQRATADEFSVVGLDHGEVANVFVDFRRAARQQRAIVGEAANQSVNRVRIRQTRFTSPHVFLPET